jgi:hypothetical protein
MAMVKTDSAIFWKLPWSFLMIIYLMVTHFGGIPLEGVAGYIFIGLGMFVLFVEFFKSGDVSSAMFMIDQFVAILAVITATALLTYLYFVIGEIPNFFYWFGFVVILADAILSPFNAFRMALRNFGVSGQ